MIRFEDILATKEKLQEIFGDDVAELVDGVTKISRYAYVSKEEQQAETFRKMLLAMVSDLRVVLVKLADRLHNMRTLQFLPEEKRMAIAKETLEIYAPIANRLGMGKIKHKLKENEIDGEVYGRVKSAYSIHSKMRRQEIDIAQLYDYFGFRIITPSV